MYEENEFFSSLSDELVDIALGDGTHGSYAARVDDGSMLDYTYETDGSWTVADKRGTAYTFGSSASGRQADPADSTRVSRWMLEEIRDANDNFVRYEYEQDGNQIYPSVITYTGN